MCTKPVLVFAAVSPSQRLYLCPIQVLCLDITAVASRSDPSDHAVSLCFTPDSSLLVLTLRGALLKFSADTGALTSKVCAA